MYKQATVLLISILLVSSIGALALASEDGIGFTQTLEATYATLNVGPFTGDLSIAPMSPDLHTRLGLSIPACCGGIYTGGLASFKFNTKASEMNFDSLHLFAGYEFNLEPVVLKFSLGPKITTDTVFYDTSTYSWNLTFRVLFNPFNILGAYECGEGDPCQVE